MDKNHHHLYSIAAITFTLCLGCGPILAANREQPTKPDFTKAVAPTLTPKCAAPFRDNAILQQKVKLPVWGTSLPGAKVKVEFNGQVKSTQADKEGKWRVVLDPMDAPKLKSVNDSPEGKTLKIVSEKDGDQAVTEIRNVIVGDVWICAGQSNMAGSLRSIIVKEGGKMNPDGLVKTVKGSYYAADTITSAIFPALRQYVSSADQDWVVCSPKTAWQFKKVAFFFGRRLQRDALVPVGLVSTAVGGSKIEAWLNKDPYAAGKNYDRLIKPLVGYGIKGVIWYQGESNARDRRAYQPKLEALITGWREAWGQGGFPFYFVQLPGIGVSPTDNPAMGDGRAEIRQACVEALALKNTGLAVTIDIGAPGEHPPNKYDTGERLARVVLRNVYGLKDVAVCPLYKSHKVEDDRIRVSFNHAESGLMLAEKEGFLPPRETPDAKMGWLSVQDKRGTWHWAEGKIDGSELVVSSREVKDPVAVRYAYTIRPVGPLLYSKDGLPVGPFSTIGYGPEPGEEKSR